MAEKIGSRGSAGDVGFNYVPLIDVTFNMIIFFALTTEVTDQAMAKVVVPTVVTDSMAQQREKGAKNYILVNVVALGSDRDKSERAPEVSRAERYEVNGQPVELGDIDALAKQITTAKTFYEKYFKGQPSFGKGEFFVDIRADRMVTYGDVKPVMLAISKAGIGKMAISMKMKE